MVLADEIGPRYLRKPDTIRRAISHIEDFWLMHGFIVRKQIYLTGIHETHNLIIERPGTQYPDDIIIVGAHYDSISGTPGADDNASAVAMLLEVSRLLKDFEPKRTLRFVAFANEEPPYFYTEHMGSMVYAKDCKQKNERILGMVCLEMVGYFTDKPNSQDYPTALPAWLKAILPSRGNFLAMVANTDSLSLMLRTWFSFKLETTLPAWGIALPMTIASDLRLSDHGPFWDAGFPAIMLTDTSHYRNDHYHMMSDTPETLDYDRMALATHGVAAAVRKLAKMRPTKC